MKTYDKIAGFRPTFMIWDKISLDRDQQMMENCLLQNTDMDLEKAKKINVGKIGISEIQLKICISLNFWEIVLRFEQ